MLLAPFGLLLRLLLGFGCGYAAATRYSPRGGRRRSRRDFGNIIRAELSQTRARLSRLQARLRDATRAQCRMFTARASTIPIVTNDASDCTSISIFALGLSGIVSVGLNAEAFVNDV